MLQQALMTINKEQAMGSADLNQFLKGIQSSAYRMAKLSTSNTEDALELVQEAMLSLVKSYAHKPEDELRALFYKILNHKITDWYRKRAFRNQFKAFFGFEQDEDPIEQFADDFQLEADDSLNNERSLNQLAEALKTLSPRQRQCFLLRAWQGFDVRETADIMNCSQGSVKTHYSRAVSQLKTLLGDDHETIG